MSVQPAPPAEARPLEAIALEHQATGSQETFAAIARRCERLVYHAAGPLCRRSPWARRNREELHAAGMLGLWLAVRTFRPERGAFIPWAWGIAYRRMQDLVRRANEEAARQGRTISLDSLRDEKGRPWTLPDPRAADPAADPDRLDVDAHLLERVATRCRPREAQVIRLHFWQGMTYRALGRQIGCSGERARQIVRRGLARLRTALPVEPTRHPQSHDQHNSQAPRRQNPDSRP